MFRRRFRKSLNENCRFLQPTRVLWSAPIAQCRLDKSQSRHRRGVGPEDTWPKGQTRHTRLLQEQRSFFLGKAALGSNEKVNSAYALLARKSERGGRITIGRFLVAKYQQAPIAPCSEILFQRLRLVDLGEAEN